MRTSQQANIVTRWGAVLAASVLAQHTAPNPGGVVTACVCVCVCVCVNFLTPLVFLEDRVKMATKKRERLNLYSLYGHKEGFGLRLLEVFGGYLNLDRLGVVGLFD